MIDQCGSACTIEHKSPLIGVVPMHFTQASRVQFEQCTRKFVRSWKVGSAGCFVESSWVLNPLLCSKTILVTDVLCILQAPLQLEISASKIERSNTQQTCNIRINIQRRNVAKLTRCTYRYTQGRVNVVIPLMVLAPRKVPPRCR